MNVFVCAPANGAGCSSKNSVRKRIIRALPSFQLTRIINQGTPREKIQAKRNVRDVSENKKRRFLKDRDDFAGQKGPATAQGCRNESLSLRRVVLAFSFGKSPSISSAPTQQTAKAAIQHLAKWTVADDSKKGSCL